MARFQFSIRALLGGMALVATGLAAMLDRSPSHWLEPAFLTLVIMLFVFAAMSAIFRRGPAQAFWGGFVVVAICYLGLVAVAPTFGWLSTEEPDGGALATTRVLRRIKEYVEPTSYTVTMTASAYRTYSPPTMVYTPAPTPPSAIAAPAYAGAASLPGTAPIDATVPASADQVELESRYWAPAPTVATAPANDPAPVNDPATANQNSITTSGTLAPASGYYAPAPVVMYPTATVATPTIGTETFMRCGQVLWALAIGGAAGLLARRFYRARHCEKLA